MGTAATLELMACGDTFVDQANPESSFGGEPLMDVGKDPSGRYSLSLINFPFTNMPEVIINSAQLVLYLEQTSGSSGGSSTDLNIYYPASEWDENTTVWNNAPGLSSKIITETVGGIGTHSFDVTTAVSSWNNANKPNYGFYIYSAVNDSIKSFCTSQYGNSNNRPKLIIDYSSPYDLSAIHLNCAPEAMLWGENFETELKIENNTASSFNVKYYLSIDNIIDVNDYLLRVWEVSDGNKIDRANLSLPENAIIGASREIYLGVIVDSGDECFEYNENNNSNTGFGIDFRRINIGPPDAWADGSSYKYYTMLSPAKDDCSKNLGYQFKDPNGTSGNNWSIVAGSLPDGINMLSNGYVNGTPTTVGTYKFTLRASSDSWYKDFDCQMKVHAPRSKWFENAKLGYWLNLHSSDETSPAVIEMDNLYFDAETWVEQAVSAGAKYVTFSAYGIPEVRYWPSKVPASCSAKTSRDFVKEVIDACHLAGIKAIMVMAIDPHGGGEFNCMGDTVEDFQLWQRKLIQELLLKGADGFWFDGAYFTRQIYGNSYFYWMWTEMEAVIRSCNPQAILITNPGAVPSWWNTDDEGWSAWKPVDEGPADIDVRTFEMYSMRTNADPPYPVPASYNFSPIEENNFYVPPYEQDTSHHLWPKRIPVEAAGMLGRDWSWGDDYLPVKTWDDLVRYLIKCWHVGATVSFATGTKGDGIFCDGDQTAMNGIGSWLDTYGEAVYNTRRGKSLRGNAVLYTTENSGKTYVFLIDYDQPTDNSLIIDNWPAEMPVYRCYNVQNENDLSFNLAAPNLTISGISWDSPATVIAIDSEPSSCGDSLHPYPAGDINMDCNVNIEDFSLVAKYWLFVCCEQIWCPGGPWCEGADINQTGQVDYLDLNKIADNWLSCTDVICQ